MNVKVRKSYMDSLFRSLFDGEDSKENLLSLYNAMNGTHYTNLDGFEYMTIENVIFMGMKNDLAFLVDCQLQLYEHQGSFNPNMPLRGFLYCSQLYEKYLAMQQVKLYGKKLVKIPTPRYVVFYNGVDAKQDIMKLRLSDAFEVQDSTGEFEWTATMININYGHNRELMQDCSVLFDYARFVERVRVYRSERESLEEAVRQAVDECIKENILAEFLRKHRGEVIDMILTEYDEQEARDWIREEGKQESCLEIGRRLKAMGMPEEEIAVATGLDVQTVQAL